MYEMIQCIAVARTDKLVSQFGICAFSVLDLSANLFPHFVRSVAKDGHVDLCERVSRRTITVHAPERAHRLLQRSVVKHPRSPRISLGRGDGAVLVNDEVGAERAFDDGHERAKTLRAGELTSY